MSRTITKSTLKTNKKETKSEMKLNSLKHLMASCVSETTYDGKDYYVVPSIGIVPGVHNNVLYEEADLMELPDSWNGRPVTNGHPKQNNQPCSASIPEVMEEYTVGMLFNCEYDDSKLKFDIYLDKDKCAEVNPQILLNLHNNTPTDISTGLFTTDIVQSGLWNNQSYDYIAKQYVPDHLAILIDEVGACNWQDGAGMARTNSENDKVDIIPSLKIMAEKKNLRILELSYSEKQYKVSQALKDRDNITNMDNSYIWVAEMYDKEVIYELEQNKKAQYFKQVYALDANEEVSLIGEPIEVVRVSEYKIKNEIKTNKQTNKQQTTNNKKGDSIVKNERITSLITNKATSWTEDNREFLSGLGDTEFEAIEKGHTVEVKAELNINSIDDALNLIPETFRKEIEAGIKTNETAKADLVAKLDDSPKCKFNKEALEAKDMDELKILSEMIVDAVVENAEVVKPADYSGNAGGEGIKTNNEEAPESAEMPDMDFS